MTIRTLRSLGTILSVLCVITALFVAQPVQVRGQPLPASPSYTPTGPRAPTFSGKGAYSFVGLGALRSTGQEVPTLRVEGTPTFSGQGAYAPTDLGAFKFSSQRDSIGPEVSIDPRTPKFSSQGVYTISEQLM